MMAVAWAHPFEQGNKRTGFIAATIFLDTNGWYLDIPDFEDIADLIIEAVENPAAEFDLVEVFRRNLIEAS
jgi:death on curing protein